MASGAWSMSDKGEFELNEPYRSALKKIKEEAMLAWVTSAIKNLEEITPYDGETLFNSFKERCQKDQSPLDIVDSFVIEAMEGHL